MVSGAAPERFPATAVGLALLGLVPFAAALYWQVTGAASPRLAIVHGALILAFLGGIRWAVAITAGSRRLSLDLAAGAVAVLAGLAAATLPVIPGLCLLIASLLAQALWDEMSAGAGRSPLWFGKLRVLLTAGAASALTVMLVIVLI